jgi:hypothetical protein
MFNVKSPFDTTKLVVPDIDVREVGYIQGIGDFITRWAAPYEASYWYSLHPHAPLPPSVIAVRAAYAQWAKFGFNQLANLESYDGHIFPPKPINELKSPKVRKAIIRYIQQSGESLPDNLEVEMHRRVKMACKLYAQKKLEGLSNLKKPMEPHKIRQAEKDIILHLKAAEEKCDLPHIRRVCQKAYFTSAILFDQFLREQRIKKDRTPAHYRRVVRRLVNYTIACYLRSGVLSSQNRQGDFLAQNSFESALISNIKEAGRKALAVC